jgi:hypothetical protein
MIMNNMMQLWFLRQVYQQEPSLLGFALVVPLVTSWLFTQAIASHVRIYLSISSQYFLNTSREDHRETIICVNEFFMYAIITLKYHSKFENTILY